jgi:hypothetical protein
VSNLPSENPHERDDFRQLCREHDVLGTAMEALCGEFWARAVKMEREACAKVCDDFHEAQNGRDNYGKFIARLIRSRALQQGD